MKSSDIHIREISQEMPQPSITKIHLKITYLKFHSNSPGAKELTRCGQWCYMAGIFSVIIGLGDGVLPRRQWGDCIIQSKILMLILVVWSLEYSVETTCRPVMCLLMPWVPDVTRSSAAIILSVWKRMFLTFLRVNLNNLCQGMVLYVNINLHFLKQLDI